SKVMGAWLAGLDVPQILVARPGVWADPDRVASRVVWADPGAFCRAAVKSAGGSSGKGDWLAAWQAVEAAAQTAIDAVLASRREAVEPGVARTLTAGLPDGSTLFVSSSMPARDVEWFGVPRRGVRILANRGANGIDGVVSSALGVALGSGGAV